MPMPTPGYTLIQRVWQRGPLALSLGICAGLMTGFAAVLWLYNTRYTWHVVSALLAGTDPVKILRDRGLLPFPEAKGMGLELLNRWITVDWSTVTTGVFVVFLGYITQGLYRVYTSRKTQQPHPSLLVATLPFPANYKTYFVSYGLLGTLFAFMVAFSLQRTTAQASNLDILYEALGTALWSSFTAILLAYGACPLVEELFAYAVRHLHPVEETSDELSQLRRAFQHLAKDADRAREPLGKLIQLLHPMEERLVIPDLLREIADQERRIADLERHLQALQERMRSSEAMAERVNDTLTHTADTVTSHDASLQSLRDDITLLQSHIEDLSLDVSQQRQSMEAIEGKITEPLKAFAKIRRFFQ